MKQSELFVNIHFEGGTLGLIQRVLFTKILGDIGNRSSSATIEGSLKAYEGIAAVNAYRYVQKTTKNDAKRVKNIVLSRKLLHFTATFLHFLNKVGTLIGSEAAITDIVDTRSVGANGTRLVAVTTAAIDSDGTGINRMKVGVCVVVFQTCNVKVAVICEDVAHSVALLDIVVVVNGDDAKRTP
jgi:hypothetical protein